MRMPGAQGQSRERGLSGRLLHGQAGIVNPRNFVVRFWESFSTRDKRNEWERTIVFRRTFMKSP